MIGPLVLPVVLSPDPLPSPPRWVLPVLLFHSFLRRAPSVLPSLPGSLARCSPFPAALVRTLPVMG